MEQKIIKKFLNPDSIINQLEIAKGSIIADFGAGPGYFSIPLAKAVGEDGKIYSLDILPQALETISSKARSFGLNNIITKRVNLENEKGSKLDANFVDFIVLKDVLFQNQNKKNIIIEAKRILKEGGSAIIIEWNLVDLTIGPEMNIRIQEEKLKEIFKENGFKIGKNINAGEFHYSFIVQK